jgi:branched-chain amino acid transport system permease protein
MIARGWLGAFVVVLLILPYLIAGRLSLAIFLFIGLFSLIVIGLTLLGGYAGQISLGQAAFYGIGAYVSAITTIHFGIPPVLALPIAALTAAAIAYLIGAPIFILRGHFLVLGTLGLNIVIDVLIRNMQGLTGGPTGLTGIPPLSIGSIPIVGDRPYYYCIWALVLTTLWLGRNLISSRVGRALAAIRASEVAAATLGISPAYYKSRVFACSAALAGMAGALYVHYLSFVSPSPFAFNFSIELLVMSVLGGIFHLPGAVLGTAIITVLREGLRTVMPRLLGSGASAEYEIVVFGVLLAIVVILSPSGVWPKFATLLRIPIRPQPLSSSVAAKTAELYPAGPRFVREGIILQVDALQKQFGGLFAVVNLSFAVRAREIYAIIGPNGAGKTTAFNLISGVMRPTGGTILLQGQSLTHLPPYRIAALGVARTFQTPKIFSDLTVLENVMVGLHRQTRSGFIRAMLGLGHREDAEAATQAFHYLDLVELAPHASALAGSLSFGAQRRLELARALATDPLLLLLDEPASGLSAAERRALLKLIGGIRDEGVTVLLVEHDVSLVMAIADRILVLNYGEQIAEGSPQQVRTDPRVIGAYLGEPST